MDIIETIQSRYVGLTKKQKQIADYMVNHIDKMSFITLKEMSAATAITETTILNACSAMGFSSFNEVKYEARKYLGLREKLQLHEEGAYFQLEIPKYDLKDQRALLKQIWEEEGALWEIYSATFNLDDIMRVAWEFLDKRNIVLCGRGISKILAEFLSIRLAGCGIASVVMDTELNDSIHAALPLFQKGVLVVVISFPDYYFMTDKIAEYAKEQKCRVICITDSKTANIAKFSYEVLAVPSNTRLFLNTLSIPMALVNILTSAIDIVKNYSGDEEEVTDKFRRLFHAKQIIEKGTMT